MWQFLLLVPMGIMISKLSVPLPSIYINDLDCNRTIRYDLSLGKPHNRALNYTIDCWPGSMKILNTTHVICNNGTTVISVDDTSSDDTSSDDWRKTPETTIVTRTSTSVGDDGVTTTVSSIERRTRTVSSTSTVVLPPESVDSRTTPVSHPSTSDVPPSQKDKPLKDHWSEPSTWWDQVRSVFKSWRNVFFNGIYFSLLAVRQFFANMWHSITNFLTGTAETCRYYLTLVGNWINRFIEDIIPGWAANIVGKVGRWISWARKNANKALETAYSWLVSTVARVWNSLVAFSKLLWRRFKEELIRLVKLPGRATRAIIGVIVAVVKFFSMTLPLFIFNIISGVYYRLQAAIFYVANTFTNLTKGVYKKIFVGFFNFVGDMLRGIWLNYIKPIVNSISPATAKAVERVATVTDNTLQASSKGFENAVELTSSTFTRIVGAFWSGIESTVLAVINFFSPLFRGIRYCIYFASVWLVEFVTDSMLMFNWVVQKIAAAYNGVVVALFAVFNPLIEAVKELVHMGLQTEKSRITLLVLLALGFVAPTFNGNLFHALCTGVGGPLAGHLICVNGAEPIAIAFLLLYEATVLYWCGGWNILTGAFTFWTTQISWLVTAAFNIASAFYLARIHPYVVTAWAYVRRAWAWLSNWVQTAPM